MSLCFLNVLMILFTHFYPNDDFCIFNDLFGISADHWAYVLQRSCTHFCMFCSLENQFGRCSTCIMKVMLSSWPNILAPGMKLYFLVTEG